jgi:hypothetical protein
MAEEKTPPDGRRTALATDLKVGDVIVDGRGRNLEVIGVDTSGKWANIQLRGDDGLEIESQYSKSKELLVVSEPGLKCAECGAPVLDERVNRSGLPICEHCDRNASKTSR